MKVDQRVVRTVDVHARAGNVVGSKDIVLYASLLNHAHVEGLARVRTSIFQIPTEENGRLAIIKAEVETTKGLFETVGDACPENIDEFIAPQERLKDLFEVSALTEVTRVAATKCSTSSYTTPPATGRTLMGPLAPSALARSTPTSPAR